MVLKAYMKMRLDKGESNWHAVAIIAVCLMALVFAPKSNENPPGKSAGTGLFSAPSFISSQSSSNESRSSSGGDSLSISSGNAIYAYQPYEEYVTVENWGRTSVDITGWQLRNGKDKRTYNLNGQLQRFSADIAVIPQATLTLQPSGASVMQDVVLAPGDRAILVTGSAPNTAGLKLVSFKENMCTGYLQNNDDYRFEPSLDTRCPDPEDEPGVTNLEASCRLFIESLPSCRTPEKTLTDNRGETCDTCVNHERISSACANFVLNHFSYRGCVLNHASDARFNDADTWHIYLGRSWEMWAENYETIELYDAFNNLRAWQNY